MVSWTASAMAIIDDLEREAIRKEQSQRIWSLYEPPQRPLNEAGRKKRWFR